jgi:hypothetical protein
MSTDSSLITKHFREIASVKQEFLHKMGIKESEGNKIWSRWVITHRSIYAQTGMFYPSDGSFDQQLINEMCDKGLSYSKSREIHDWLSSFKITQFSYNDCIRYVQDITVSQISNGFIMLCDEAQSWYIRTNRFVYDKLKKRFCLPQNEHFANYCIWVVCTLYELLDGHGLQWALPPKAMTVLEDLNCRTELFASPINCHLLHYYSLFNIDYLFGSSGNFFTADPKLFVSGVYQINPPFIDSLFTLTTHKILSLLSIAEENGKSLTFIYIMPEWSDFPTYNLILQSVWSLRNIHLKPGQHFYYQYSNNSYIRARFGTYVVVLSTNTRFGDDSLRCDLIDGFQYSRRRY